MRSDPRFINQVSSNRMTIRIKFLCLFFACVASHASIARAPQISMEELAEVTPEFTAERDAAAAYLRERPFFLQQMSGRCREILGMPPAPSSGAPEESRWRAANFRYLAAAVRYRDKRRTHRDGDPLASFQTAMQEARELQKKVHAETDARLEASTDPRQTCRIFFADSEEGRLDITPADAHYEALEGMARELFDPPSRDQGSEAR